MKGKAEKLIPHFRLPERIRSRRQYVTWTKLARDILVRYHGFRAEDFIRIGRSEPSLGYTTFFPWHWQTIWRYGPEPRWSGYLEKMPRGAVIYWPDGFDICGDAHDARCVIDILHEIQWWSHYNFEEEEEPCM